MSSGFQQDINQLAPSFYRVAIDMSNTTAFPVINPGNSQNGGCTPNTWDFFAAGSLPTTQAKADARARGNIRFKNIVRELTNLGDCQILDVTITEANADAQATALSFTVKYDRDEFIPLTGQLQGTATVGNDSAGNPMDTKAKAIANAIGHALYVGRSESVRVYNPTTSEGMQVSITANANTTEETLLGKVTVTAIDTTTLVNV
jgi:hypothetical protein